MAGATAGATGALADPPAPELQPFIAAAMQQRRESDKTILERAWVLRSEYQSVAIIPAPYATFWEFDFLTIRSMNGAGDGNRTHTKNLKGFNKIQAPLNPA